MPFSNSKIGALVAFLVALLVASIFVYTIYYRSSHMNRNVTKLYEPEAASMYLPPWRVNATPEAIRAKQAHLMLSYQNYSVNPCDDFYEYACGNWETQNPIPKDKWQYSTIHVLQDNLERELKDLLSEPFVFHDPPSAIDKAKAYYKSCMDDETSSRRGIKPILEYIQQLGGWPVLDDNWTDTNFDWLNLTIHLSFIGDGVIIAHEVEKNPTVPNENSLYIKQTTLGMSNRDNYLKEENSKNLEAYRKLIEKTLLLFNVNKQKAQNVSQEIVEFEVRLANATLPPEAVKTEQFIQANIPHLQKSYPYIDWNKYISGITNTETNDNQTVIMQLGVKYLVNLYHLLVDTTNDTMANYMIWRFVLYVNASLGSNFREAWDDFNAAITGQVEPKPLWKTCVNQVNWCMGMATSAMFVKKYFDESSKNETIKIISSIKDAFDENLAELEWIDESTKNYARKKSSAMSIAAGYPDFILLESKLNKLYENFTIVEGNHFENLLNAFKTHWKQRNARIFKPFNKDRWHLPPTMVNALYDTGANRIIILAGLLQPPVFNRHFPQFLNYGAMGMFMGHELIHGFDDIGRRFDSDGNVLNWWNDDAVEQFQEKQNCFLEEYEKFSKLDNTFKSIATISENLADNGGMRLAYKAYNNWKKSNNYTRDEEFANMNLTDDQLFFLSFAQLFCGAIRPEATVESRSYEAHSPRKYRVLGTLMNFDKFSEAYGCPVDSPLNPSKKCRLW